MENAMAISVIPSGAALGAEVIGVDFSRNIDDQAFAIIENALHQHSVICLRGSKANEEQQISLSRRFGELEYIPGTHKSDYPELHLVSNVVNDSGKPIGLVDAGVLWHTDMSYVEHPSRVSILNAVEVPHDDSGQPLGDTWYASTAAAYDALPESMKRRLVGLKAVHRHVHYLQKTVAAGKERGRPTRQVDIEKEQARFPDVIHPVIRTHPATGRKCIFVTAGESVAIVGMPDDEARELINELSEHCTKPEFLYRHQWRVGGLGMWDNRPTLPRPPFNYALPQPRFISH